MPTIKTKRVSLADKDEIRRANMRAILQHRSVKSVAAAIGCVPNWVSQLTNKHRTFSEKTALKVEKALGLPAGALDTPPAPPPQSDLDLLEEVAAVVGVALQAQSVKLSKSTHKKLVRFCFDEAKRSGRVVDRAHVRKAVELVRG